MNIVNYLLPVFVIFIIVCSMIKKVETFSVFNKGVTSALKLIFTIFPAILAVLLMSELFEKSGLYDCFLRLFSPVLSFFGIPKEVFKLLVLKPFSGSGSLALLNEIFIKHGASGYIPLCAIAIFGSSETIFYVSALYYANCKNKKATKGIIISLVATFVSAIFACLICKLFV